MYIGKLNHLTQFSLSNVTLSVTGTVPNMTYSGNPLLGERLFVTWKDKIYSGIDVRLPLTQKVFVDCVKLSFSPGLELSAVTLYSGQKQQLLQRYTPETGGVISKQEITLDANYETDFLFLSFEGDFSCVGLEKMEIFGSYGNNALYPTPENAKISDVHIPISQFQGCWSNCPEGIKAARILEKKLAA